MDPETSELDKAYAPPAGEVLPSPASPAEPWTLGTCIAASTRTGVRSPVLVPYLAYRLSLASCALVDANANFRQALIHSWKRTGANPRQFLVLFVVTSIPLGVSFALTLAAPIASTVFDVATLPLTTLCWAHAYDSGLCATDPRDGSSFSLHGSRIAD